MPNHLHHTPPVAVKKQYIPHPNENGLADLQENFPKILDERAKRIAGSAVHSRLERFENPPTCGRQAGVGHMRLRPHSADRTMREKA